MKTIQYLLILGLLVPHFSLAYDIPGDIVAWKNTIEESGDFMVPTGNSALVLLAGRWILNSTGLDYIAFWEWKEKERIHDSLSLISPCPLTDREEGSFTIDCVRNL